MNEVNYQWPSERKRLKQKKKTNLGVRLFLGVVIRSLGRRHFPDAFHGRELCEGGGTKKSETADTQ